MSAGSTSDPVLAQRIREIQEKEARIIQLEKELDNFENDIKSDSKGVRPLKNWPCKSYAFARNAIDIDIPIQYQRAVKKFYSLWWLTVLCTIINWLCIIWWASCNKCHAGATFQDYLFATLYVVIGAPLSWMLLYKRFYRAMQQNGALGSLFFLFLFAHLVWVGIMAIGLELMDAAGWLIMGKTFGYGANGLGIMMLISALLWSINGLATLYLLRVAQYSYGMYLATKHANMAENFT